MFTNDQALQDHSNDNMFIFDADPKRKENEIQSDNGSLNINGSSGSPSLQSDISNNNNVLNTCDKNPSPLSWLHFPPNGDDSLHQIRKNRNKTYISLSIAYNRRFFCGIKYFLLYLLYDAHSAFK